MSTENSPRDAHIDTMVSLLSGHKKTDLEALLMQDFTMYLSMMLLKMFILTRPNGKELANTILLEWRKRIIDNHAKEMAEIRQATKETHIGTLFESFIDIDDFNKRYMKAFNGVVEKIETLIRAEVKSE